jgi:isochorismate hydrolase
MSLIDKNKINIITEMRKKSSIMLVIDPQMGWITPCTKIVFRSIIEFIDLNKLEKNTVIALFSNSKKSNFRTLMPEWDGFTDDKDKEIIRCFSNKKFKKYYHHTYSMPPVFWKDLRSREIKHLFLTGVETDASIIKTAMDAFDKESINM